MSVIFFFGYEKHVFFSPFFSLFLGKHMAFIQLTLYPQGPYFHLWDMPLLSVRVVQFWVTGYNKVFNGGSVLALFISVTLREQRG